METEKQNIPANEDEIALSTYTGEALWKIQTVEQALSCLITLKLNPDQRNCFSPCYKELLRESW